jgi:hypothetical protein
MVDPSDPKFFAAWQASLEKLKLIFKNGEQDAQTRPIAEKLDQYFRATLEVAELLYASGQRDLAMRFHLLAEALNDAAEGRNPPLFKVEKRRGRQSDTNEIWRLRANLCIGIQYLIASRMEEDKAITFVDRKYRTQFRKLLRPGLRREKSDLKARSVAG